MISVKVENLVIKYRTLNGISIQNDFFQRRESVIRIPQLMTCRFKLKKVRY